MTNLGFQTAFAMLSELPGALCHRAFFDFQRTVEANRSLSEYDVAAFSISFEGDYPAIPDLLRAGGIAPRAADRSEEDPLVLIGGIAPTLNPEPLAPFSDIVFLGEAEAGLAELHNFILSSKKLKRKSLLQSLAESNLPGVYVPSAYEVIEDNWRVVERKPKGNAPDKINRIWSRNPWSPARTRILPSDGPFNGAYLIEVSRGCPHGCRFCAAGYATRPARFLPASLLFPHIERGLKESGRIGFVGAAVSDHPEFKTICRMVLDGGGLFALSSLRAETLTSEKLELIVQGGIKTVTVAMEAGTERLRNLLGKNISESNLMETARLAGKAGIRNLRIYAMLGLPSETDEDIESLVELSVRARKALGKGKISLSAAPFVPKPHTPLQWSEMAPEKQLKNRIRLLKKLCAWQKGINISVESPKQARSQAVFSRGGRSIADILDPGAMDAYTSKSINKSGAEDTLDREIGVDEILPWEFIGSMPDKQYLLKEKLAAGENKLPKQCQGAECRICGICC